MNLYDKNSKQIGSLSIHEYSGNFILNKGKGNILYKYEDYEKLFVDLFSIELNMSKEKIIEELKANSEKFTIIIKNKNSKKTKEIPNQLSLF